MCAPNFFPQGHYLTASMPNKTSAAEEIAFTTVFSVLVLVNLIGNTLVCTIIAKNPVLRTSINILIVNLAVSDMLVALSIVPQHVLKDAFVHPSGTTGDNLCRFITGGSFVWLGDKSSLFTLVLIALERFKGVHSPLSATAQMSKRTLGKLIAVCWAISFVLNAPLFYATRYTHKGTYRCEDNWYSDQTLAKVYTVITFLAIGAVPLGAIVYLYTRVVYALWSRTIHASSNAAEKKVIQERKSVTKMVIAVSLLFGVLRFPNLALYSLSQFQKKKYNFGAASFKVSVVLVALNSSINPFIYSLHSTRFRKHLRHILDL